MIELNEEKREALLDKVTTAIEEMESNLRGVWTKYEKWRKYAENKPEFEAKSYPHAKAANVAVPLTPVAHQTMYGALWAGVADRKPLVIAEPVQREDELQKAQSDCITEYLEILAEDENELGFKGFLRDWLSSSALLGIGFAKTVWDKRTHEVAATRRDADGGTENFKYSVTLHDGPRVLFVQPENILWDQAFQDLRRTPVLAERFILSEEELLEKVASGEYEEAEDVLEGLTTQESTAETDQRSRVESNRGETPVAELYECHVLFDVDDDGFFEDLICVVHKDTRSLLYCEFNSFGERMISSVAYENRPGWLQGQGIGQKTEYMQEVSNTLYNSRLDGIGLTEIPLYLVRRGSGIPLNEDIYPGKRIEVDSVSEDFLPLAQPQSFLNTRAEEQGAMFWAQKNTGASDTLAGFPDSVMRSSDTVGGQVLRLKQSSAMYATILENYEAALTVIFQKVFKLLVMHKDEVMERERKIGRLSQNKLGMLEQALTMDVSEIPLKVRFRINTTDVDETFEMQRQNLMTITQIMSMFYEKMIQLGEIIDAPDQMIGPTQKAVASSAMESATKMMADSLKLFNHGEALGSLPDVKKLEFLRKFRDQMFGMGLMMQAQQVQGGGGNGIQASPPMGGIPGAGGAIPAGGGGAIGIPGTAEQAAGGGTGPG